MTKTVKTTNNKRKININLLNKSTWGRYYGVIISALLFLTLDSLVFLFNIYISNQVEENGIRVNLAGRQGALNQQITKTLLQIQHRIEQGENIELPKNELKLAYQTFDKVLYGFKNGGIVPDVDDQPIHLNIYDSDIESLLINSSIRIWEPLKPKLESIINTDTVSMAMLSDCIHYSLANDTEFSKTMNSLTFEIEKTAESEIAELRFIQTFGIVLALLNFTFLLAHFISRLTEKDKELERYSTDLEEKVEIRTKQLEEQKLKLAGYSQGLEHLVETKTKELRLSEEKYRSIFESFPDIYLQTDMMGNIQVISPSVQFQTGYTMPELISHPLQNMFESRETYDEMIDLLKEKTNITDYEIMVGMKDGGSRDMTFTARVMFRDSLPIGYEGVLHDITQQKLDARKLNNINEELLTVNTSLKKAIEMKQEFLAIASHDLKNPISAIMGVTQLMEMEGGMNESQKENIHMVKTTATYTLDFIEQLVKNAMLDDEDLKLNKTEFDLAELASEVVNLNKVSAQNKGQDFKVNIGENIFVYADRHKIREAMDNLVSNAVKYSPYEKNIEIDLIPNGVSCLFKVKDEGPGLTEDDKKKVFGKFQKLSASPTGNESSSGLGLNIVKRIIELHNGKCWVESEEGKGATFIFEFPKKSNGE